MEIDLGRLIASTVLAGCLTAIAIAFLSPIARRVGLTDCPGGRKQHEGDIPLIGGIAIVIGAAAGLLYASVAIPGLHAFVTALSLLFAIGVIDDYLDIPAILKLIAQIIAAFIMVYWGDLRIDGLANMFFPGALYLGPLSVPVTVLAVVGYINAINMSDGVDGLAGSLTLVSLLALLFVAWDKNLAAETYYLAVFAASILVFLIFNARHPLRAKAGIFLGDAGSLLCGFIVAWFLVHLATMKPRAIDAPTALWIVGVPFIDMVAVMLRRIVRKKSPFSADREHFHHLLLSAGFTVNQAVVAIAGLAATFSVIGLCGQYMNVPGPLLFYAFFILFVIALLALMYAWRVQKMLASIRKMMFWQSRCNGK